MSIEQLKALAEVVVLCLAAGWGIAGFFLLKQRQKAIAEVRKTDLEAKKLELDSRQTANVDVRINATAHADPSGTGFVVLAEVELRNVGSRDTRIEWKGQPAPFSVRRTTFNFDGSPQFTSPAIELRARQARDANVEPVSAVLRAGGRQTLTFTALVAEPGIYLLSFRGVVSDKEAEVSKEAGAQQSTTKGWTSTKFLVVAPSTKGQNGGSNDG